MKKHRQAVLFGWGASDEGLGFIKRCSEAVWVLSACRGKEGLTTSSALDMLGEVAYNVAGMQVFSTNQVVADGDGQGRRFWVVRHGPLGEAP